MQSETERNSGTPPLIFDRFAAFYDGDYRNYDDDLDAISQLAEEEDGPILELGCGTGRVLVPLAGLGHNVTGVDISPALLDVTRAKLRTTHYAPRATLLESDLRTFDLPAKNYALAICTSNTLMHFTSPEEQLEERNESFWVLVPYVTWCVRYVWGFPIYFLCIKYRWLWI